MGGKRNTMVMMFVGGVVLLFDGFFVLFLPYEIYRAGVFHSCLNPYSGKAVNCTLLLATDQPRFDKCGSKFVKEHTKLWVWEISPKQPWLRKPCIMPPGIDMLWHNFFQNQTSWISYRTACLHFPQPRQSTPFWPDCANHRNLVKTLSFIYIHYNYMCSLLTLISFWINCSWIYVQRSFFQMWDSAVKCPCTARHRKQPVWT